MVILDEATWYDIDEVRLYSYDDFAIYDKKIRNAYCNSKVNNETFGAHVLEKFQHQLSLRNLTETNTKVLTMDSEIMGQNEYLIF